MRDLR